jgi:hypothetical protein
MNLLHFGVQYPACIDNKLLKAALLSLLPALSWLSSDKVIFGDGADLCTATPSLLLRFIQEPYVRGPIVDVLVIRSDGLCCKV